MGNTPLSAWIDHFGELQPEKKAAIEQVDDDPEDFATALDLSLQTNIPEIEVENPAYDGFHNSNVMPRSQHVLESNNVYANMVQEGENGDLFMDFKSVPEIKCENIDLEAVLRHY